MWSKKLGTKIAKHRAFGKEILDYANTIGFRSKSVNKLAIDLESQKITEERQQKIRGKNNPVFEKNTAWPIPSFYEKLKKMIEKYRQEETEIRKLKVKEKTGEPSIEKQLPLNPNLEKLAQMKKPIIRIWHNGTYKCTSLKEFIGEYEKIAGEPTPSLMEDYLISERTGKHYPIKTIYEALRIHRQNKT